MSSEETPVTEELFPKGGSKSYALVEMMPREGPMVGKGPDNTVFSFPVVLLWEIVLLFGVTFVIFLFSLIKQAPLEEMANPMVTIDPAKAPWYFVGLQELLEHMHPTVAGILIPSVLIGFLIALQYIDHSRENVGVWFTSQRGKQITLYSAIYTLIVMPAFIILDNAFTLRELLRDSVPQWVAQGLVPVGILVVLTFLPTVALWRMRPNRREIALALFTVMLVSAFVFTVSGFFFRGPGFKLFLPWQMPDGYNPLSEF